MTEPADIELRQQPAQDAGQPPAPGSVPGPQQPAPPPEQPAASQPWDQKDASAQPGPATGQADPETSSRVAELQGELDRLRAGEEGPGAVRMKVEGPHESITYGGLTVGTEYITVPAHMVAAIATAAAEAGVTITQES